jgi:hypothetical protein
MNRPCLGTAPGRPCPYNRLTPRTRCPECDAEFRAARESRRPNRIERGYGATHYQARALLAETLPAPCAYCGATLTADRPWVAAHVVDGDPSAGWTVSCPGCNQAAKRRPDSARPAPSIVLNGGEFVAEPVTRPRPRADRPAAGGRAQYPPKRGRS